MTKWKNKFKLWKILHPYVDLEGDFSYCVNCPHTLFAGTHHKLFRRCPDWVLVYIEDDAGEMQVLNLNRTVDEHFKWGHCVEWIKHV